ncbi:MAG: hypothetical protein V7785_21985 [Bermanella sp.]
MAFELTEDIRVSPVGTHVVEFKKGKHDSLPVVAVCYARSKKLFKGEPKGKEVENKDWAAHAKSIAEKAEV